MLILPSKDKVTELRSEKSDAQIKHVAGLNKGILLFSLWSNQVTIRNFLWSKQTLLIDKKDFVWGKEYDRNLLKWHWTIFQFSISSVCVQTVKSHVRRVWVINSSINLDWFCILVETNLLAYMFCWTKIPGNRLFSWKCSMVQNIVVRRSSL